MGGTFSRRNIQWAGHSVGGAISERSFLSPGETLTILGGPWVENVILVSLVVR